MNKLIEKKVVKEISYIQDDFEYYAQLFEDFQNHKCNETQLEIWRCDKIIELMENLRFSVNREFVRDALVLILTLYYGYTRDYALIGAKDTKNLSRDERTDYLMILKTEFVQTQTI